MDDGKCPNNDIYDCQEYLESKEGKPKGTWNPEELLSGREVLIVGGGKSVIKYSDKI